MKSLCRRCVAFGTFATVLAWIVVGVGAAGGATAASVPNCKTSQLFFTFTLPPSPYAAGVESFNVVIMINNYGDRCRIGGVPTIEALATESSTRAIATAKPTSTKSTVYTLMSHQYVETVLGYSRQDAGPPTLASRRWVKTCKALRASGFTVSDPPYLNAAWVRFVLPEVCSAGPVNITVEPLHLATK